MIQGIHRYPPMDRVIYGIPLARALADEVSRLDARAVYVMASGTLHRETDVIEGVRRVLGNRFAGVCARIGSHTPRVDVVAAANEARTLKADLILTVGGGSVTDAAKMVGLCLGNNVSSPRQLDAFRAVVTPDGKTERPPVEAPAVRSIDNSPKCMSPEMTTVLRTSSLSIMASNLAFSRGKLAHFSHGCSGETNCVLLAMMRTRAGLRSSASNHDHCCSPSMVAAGSGFG